MIRPLIVSTLLALAARLPLTAASPPPTAADLAFFENKVRPLLVARCYECPSDKKQKGGLRLDSQPGWQAGGDTGAVIVPGDPAKSLLLEAIGRKNEDLPMPPQEALGAAEVAVLTEWIQRGAPDPRPSGRPHSSPISLPDFAPQKTPHPECITHRNAPCLSSVASVSELRLGSVPHPNITRPSRPMPSAPIPFPHPLSRRDMLRRCGAGLGTRGLAALLGADTAAGPLAPRPPHFRPRANDVIQILANGGPAQMDTFDPKPVLTKLHGQRLPLPLATERPTSTALGSPFSFARYGQSGLEVSERFAPLAAQHADDLWVIRSMYSDSPIHENCLRLMNCGASILARPSIGSWITYGLGTENQNLPGFVVLVPKGMPVAGAANGQSSFLPGAYQGTDIETQDRTAADLIDHLTNPDLDPTAQRAQLDFTAALNRRHQATRSDPAFAARIQSFEAAFRMQTAATDAFDIDREPESIRTLYGDTAQAKQMLLARRLVERGVRFVQVWHGTLQPWDSHDHIEKSHRRFVSECGRGLTALLTDLKQRGLFDDTLVIWGGEFGRTPTVELSQGEKVSPTAGRDHTHHGFTMWFAGRGTTGGYVHGATDDFGFKAVTERVHVHDLQATGLHLLGLDHERLTYRHSGRDFRLTDVSGNVVHRLLA